MGKRDGFDQRLRSLAGAASASSFSLRRDGVSIEVEVRTDDDDVVTSVVYGARYDAHARPLPASYREGKSLRATRPLSITLRREDAGDVVAKEEGDAVEWQSGDADFDREVYVDSPTRDREVLSSVLNPSARAAAAALLAMGFSAVEVDVAGRVTATLGASSFGPSERVDDTVDRSLDAMTRLLTSLPVVDDAGGAHPRAPLSRLTTALGVVGAAGWLLNVGYAGLLAMASRELLGVSPREVPVWSTVGAVVGALCAGVMGAGAYAAAVKRLARGRSDAHTLASRAWIRAFGGFSVIAFSAAFVASLAVYDGR